MTLIISSGRPHGQRGILQRGACLLLMLLIWMLHVPGTDAMVGVEDGRQLFQAERYTQSKKVLEDVLASDPHNDRAHYYLCRTAFALEQYDQAIKSCKTAIALQEANADYHFWLGRSYGAKAAHANALTQAVLAPKVRQAFERAVELDPRHIQGQIGLINFYLRAPTMMGGDLQKAYVRALLLVDQQELQGKLLLARVYERQQRFEVAELTYQNLARVYGRTTEHRTIHDAYGRFLLRRKRYAEAIQQFQQQIALAPEQADAYDSLGDAYRAAGHLDKATAAYRKALRLDPRFTQSQSKLEATEKALEESSGGQ